jgi:hypothetical protein
VISNNCNLIIRKFLQNLRPQLNPQARCCVAVPVWNSPRGFIHLPIVDQLEELGYRRVRFSHVKFGQLIYHRPDQHVARELLVLTVK